MTSRFPREIGFVLAWLLFPLVPVVLEDAYYGICNFEFFENVRFGPEPHDWDWTKWLLMLGPLVGYGFLAGATTHMPDEIGLPGRPVPPLLAAVSLGSFRTLVRRPDGIHRVVRMGHNCVRHCEIVPIASEPRSASKSRDACGHGGKLYPISIAMGSLGDSRLRLALACLGRSAAGEAHRRIMACVL